MKKCIGFMFLQRKNSIFIFDERIIACFFLDIDRRLVCIYLFIYFFLSILASHCALCTTKGRIQIKICIYTRLENKDRQNGERDNEGGY